MEKLKELYKKYQTPILVTVTAGVALAIGVKVGKSGNDKHFQESLNKCLDMGLVELTELGSAALGRLGPEAMAAAEASLAEVSA